MIHAGGVTQKPTILVQHTERKRTVQTNEWLGSAETHVLDQVGAHEKGDERHNQDHEHRDAARALLLCEPLRGDARQCKARLMFFLNSRNY